MNNGLEPALVETFQVTGLRVGTQVPIVGRHIAVGWARLLLIGRRWWWHGVAAAKGGKLGIEGDGFVGIGLNPLIGHGSEGIPDIDGDIAVGLQLHADRPQPNPVGCQRKPATSR